MLSEGLAGRSALTVVDPLSDTIKAPWNRPKISDPKFGLPKPAQPHPRLRLRKWRHPPLFPRQSAAAFSSSSPAPKLRPGSPPSPSPAAPRRPSFGAYMSGPNNNRVSGLSVLFCTEHFDVDVMERSWTTRRRGGMILIGEKKMLGCDFVCAASPSVCCSSYI